MGGESNLSSLLRGMSLRNSHLQNSSSSSSTHMCAEPFCTLYSGLRSDPGDTFSQFVFLAFSAESPKALYRVSSSSGLQVLPLISSCIVIKYVQDLPRTVGCLVADLIFSW